MEGALREYTYSITVPREEEYFPVVRYKCSTSLRPVPIVSYLDLLVISLNAFFLHLNIIIFSEYKVE